MAEPAQSGGYRTCLDNVRTLLANCAAVQTFLGAANAAAALALIRRDHVTTASLPLIRVFMPPEQYSRREVASQTWSEAGRAVAIFRISPSGSYTTREEWEAWAANTVGDVVDQCHALVDGGGGYIRVREMGGDSAVMFSEREAVNPYVEFGIFFRFSTDEGGG